MSMVLSVLFVGLAMFATERLRPGRIFPRVRGWEWRAITLVVVQACLSWATVTAWASYFPKRAMFDLGDDPTAVQALLGYTTITFVFYWWHRWRHEVPFLWRWLHQIHHSPSRLEALTSFYKHPLEIAIDCVLSSFVVYNLLGIEPATASIVFTMTGLGELFYHWNVKTPYWLGYFFQRPESHCVHHEAGHHTDNFSDLPVWDMLFGTFDNPMAAPSECGLGIDAEQRLLAMLMGKDVTISAEVVRPSSAPDTKFRAFTPWRSRQFLML